MCLYTAVSMQCCAVAESSLPPPQRVCAAHEIAASTEPALCCCCQPFDKTELCVNFGACRISVLACRSPWPWSWHIAHLSHCCWCAAAWPCISIGGRGEAGKARCTITPGILAAISTICTCNADFVGKWEEGKLVDGTRTFRNGDVLHVRETAPCCVKCRGPNTSGTNLEWFSLTGSYAFHEPLAGDAFGNNGKPLGTKKRSKLKFRLQRSGVGGSQATGTSAPNRRCGKAISCWRFLKRLDIHALVLVVFAAILGTAFGFAVIGAWTMFGAGMASFGSAGGLGLAVLGAGILFGMCVCALFSPCRRASEGWGYGSLWQLPPLSLVTDVWAIVALQKLHNVDVDIRWDRPISRMW